MKKLNKGLAKAAVGAGVNVQKGEEVFNNPAVYQINPLQLFTRSNLKPVWIGVRFILDRLFSSSEP